jgi:hypothetical protein
MSATPIEGKLGDHGVSPTAASASNPLYGPSSEMLYRVTLSGGAGLLTCDVDAFSGDDAARNALSKHLGCKVMHVEPAPQRPKLSAKA